MLKFCSQRALAVAAFLDKSSELCVQCPIGVWAAFTPVWPLWSGPYSVHLPDPENTPPAIKQGSLLCHTRHSILLVFCLFVLPSLPCLPNPTRPSSRSANRLSLIYFTSNLRQSTHIQHSRSLFSVLYIFYILIYFSITITMQGNHYYYPIVTDEETETQRD